MTLNDKSIRAMVNEELSKKEVSDMIDDRIEKLMKKRDFERRVKDIACDVADNVFEKMWLQKSFWKNIVRS